MQIANTPPLQSTTPGLHPRKLSPDGAARARKDTSDYSLLLSLSTSKGWKAESTCMAGYTYRNKVPPPGVEPGHVTHPSTNRDRRRVTSLIRPTLLPLRHAANRIRMQLTTPMAVVLLLVQTSVGCQCTRSCQLLNIKEEPYRLTAQQDDAACMQCHVRGCQIGLGLARSRQTVR